MTEQTAQAKNYGEDLKDMEALMFSKDDQFVGKLKINGMIYDGTLYPVEPNSMEYVLEIKDEMGSNYTSTLTRKLPEMSVNNKQRPVFTGTIDMKDIVETALEFSAWIFIGQKSQKEYLRGQLKPPYQRL